MTDKLTKNEHVRVAALNAAALLYTSPGEFDGDDVVIETAQKFERYIKDLTPFEKYQQEARIVKDEPRAYPSTVHIYQTPREISYTNSPGDELPDFTGCVISVGDDSNKHTHLPQLVGENDFAAHCPSCGLTAYLTMPNDPNWQVVV